MAHYNIVFEKNEKDEERKKKKKSRQAGNAGNAGDKRNEEEPPLLIGGKGGSLGKGKQKVQLKDEDTKPYPKFVVPGSKE